MNDANICIFWDSITWGAFDYSGWGWADRLKSRFMSSMANQWMEIFNLGICWKTSENLIARFEIEAKSRDCDIAIVAIGINDAWFRGSESNNLVSPTDFQNNLQTIHQLSNKLDIKRLIFVWLTRVEESVVNPFPGSSTGKSFKNHLIEKYDHIIQSYCRDHGIEYIDIATSFDTSCDLDSDGLHPNDRGHEKMADIVHKYIIQNI